MTKSDLIAALRGFISQRSGIDSRNYFSDWRDASGVAAFRADYRRILRDGRHARRLIEAVAWRDSITADAIIRSAGGRLEIAECDGKVTVSYCAGQYFSTEYRAAVCRLLARVFWVYWQCDGADADAIRKRARDEFGRGIAQAWFN